MSSNHSVIQKIILRGNFNHPAGLFIIISKVGDMSVNQLLSQSQASQPVTRQPYS
jgi:hypothetical protein